jgi:site-specific recombinase XerD
MQIDIAITQFVQHRTNRRCSPRTIEQYNYHLRDLWLRWLTTRGVPLVDLSHITLDVLVAYFSYLSNERYNSHTKTNGLSPETVNGAWRTMRAFINFCFRRKWASAEQSEWFKSDEYIPRPRIDERVRPVLEDEDYQKLLNACVHLDYAEERARGRALLLVLGQSGMRISELASMRDEKIDLAEYCALIIGKGNREEWVFWNREAAQAIKHYLAVRTGEPGAFWRRLNGVAMTVTNLRMAVKKLAKIAGVTLPRGASIHSLRHRFAHKAIDSGLDVSQTSQLMRHRNIQTTLRYLRENKKRLQRIHRKVNA